MRFLDLLSQLAVSETDTGTIGISRILPGGGLEAAYWISTIIKTSLDKKLGGFIKSLDYFTLASHLKEGIGLSLANWAQKSILDNDISTSSSSSM